MADESPLRAEKIVAVVTLDQQKVMSGGAPIFVAAQRDELEQVALSIARIMGAMVHDLGNDCLIVVLH